ncbi:MAG: MBL fold metallo-hydrolase [Alphaproteobacteria bacterium]|nr:MAG: MBL fold metallo-hydrolase [Alphaproteobacteria bacterium]
MKITILGCGGSGGVPLIGNNWGRCDPDNPKNRRLRPSIFIEDKDLGILVDTSPDLRQQLLASDIQRIDAVLYTHPHADHLHGIDDMRGVNRLMQKAIPIYAGQQTLDEIHKSFSYVLKQLPEGHGFYKPQLQENLIKPFEQFQVGHLSILPIEQEHGFIKSFGFRIGDFAYCTDVVDFSPRAMESLSGIKTWIIDCFLLEAHQSHAHFAKVVDWAGQLKPERTILTHMSAQLDYDKLLAKCPPGMEPAFDGMVLDI